MSHNETVITKLYIIFSTGHCPGFFLYGNINYQGLDTSGAYDAYADYFFNGGDLQASAEAMAAGLQEALASGQLTDAEANTLNGVLTELVGDIDSTQGVGDNGKQVIGEGTRKKIIESSADVTYGQSSLDKAFGKHSMDFGTYPDGSKESVELFKNDINNLIETGVKKSGTYRATQGTHVYNPKTRQWAFFNSDGSFNTAFKLSSDQFKYLIETGVVK